MFFAPLPVLLALLLLEPPAPPLPVVSPPLLALPVVPVALLLALPPAPLPVLALLALLALELTELVFGASQVPRSAVVDEQTMPEMQPLPFVPRQPLRQAC
jgi:hypothetical protein